MRERKLSLIQALWTYIQLFRQRLSHKSVKAYATMPIGIMGSKDHYRTVFVLFPSTTLKQLQVQSNYP